MEAEDTIGLLFTRLLAASNQEEAAVIALELRQAIHRYVEDLRTRVKVSFPGKDAA